MQLDLNKKSDKNNSLSELPLIKAEIEFLPETYNDVRWRQKFHFQRRVRAIMKGGSGQVAKW